DPGRGVHQRTRGTRIVAAKGKSRPPPRPPHKGEGEERRSHKGEGDFPRWIIESLSLLKELADRPILVHATDRLGQQGRHREHPDLRMLLLRWQWDGVGDYHLVDGGGGQF